MSTRAEPIINSFVSGESSPKLGGRIDIQQYYQSAYSLRNMLVEFYGGAKKRPGTVFVAEVKTSSKQVRLIPFKFSTEQAYIIEVGDYYMRFYKDDGQIEYLGAPYEISTPYSENDIWQLQFAQDDDIMYIAHPDYALRKLTRTAHTSWTMTAVDYSVDPARPALMPMNTTTTTITPSAATGNITLTASTALFDTNTTSLHLNSIWKIHNGYVKITAVTDSTHANATVLYSGNLGGTSAYADWYEGAWSAKRGYPHSVTMKEQRLVTAGTDSQPQTVWESQILAYDNFETGAEDDDGLSYEIATNEVEAIKFVFPGKSLLIGTEGGLHSLSSGSTTAPLTPSNIYVSKEQNFAAADNLLPKAIGGLVFYFQKYARILREITYNLYSEGFDAYDATAFSEHITTSGIVDLAYQQSPDSILWCVKSNGELALFTRQVEQKVSAWTPAYTQGKFESVAVIPREDHDQVWFVVKRKINGSWKRYVEYLSTPDFEDQEDAYFVDCGLSLNSPIEISTFTKTDPVLVYTVTAHGFSNGDVVKIRGVKSFDDETAELVDIDEINKRRFTVANVTANTFTLKDMDGADIDGTAWPTYEEGGEVRKCVNSISGLSHLEGKTVQVLADGGAHPDCVVTSGAITLDGYYGEVHAGLKYIGEIITNDPEIYQGSTKGKTRRCIKVTISLYRSLGCKIGNESKLDEMIFRTSAMIMDRAPELLTDDKEMLFPAGYTKRKRIYVRQEQPLPLHVLSITPWMEYGEN